MQKQLADARREGREQANARARSLAAFYASGGALNVQSCLIPGWHPDSRIGLLTIAAVALATAGGLYLLGSRTSERLCHVLLVVGSVLIGACMLSAGPSPMAFAYAFFFSWVGVYAANWFHLRALTVHLAIAAGCEAGALFLVGLDGLVVPGTLVSIGACAAAGLVVRQLRTQVRELAMRDPLTGALNRRGLTDELLRSARQAESLTVVALDLDGFKAYNDSRGHAQGDQALRECVEEWTALLGAGEICARLGGDEFVLICHRPTDAVAALVAQARGCAPAPLGVSAGAATAAPGESLADLFARADAALYVDKNVPSPRSDPDATPAVSKDASSPVHVRAH